MLINVTVVSLYSLLNYAVAVGMCSVAFVMSPVVTHPIVFQSTVTYCDTCILLFLEVELSNNACVYFLFFFFFIFSLMTVATSLFD